MTANPKWMEIIDALHPFVRTEDHPELVAHGFEMKCKEMIEDVYHRSVFGNAVARVHTTEFQKCSLPHTHFLLFLDGASRIWDGRDVDRFVCAEIPD